MKYKKGKKITDDYQFKKGKKYVVEHDEVFEFSHIGEDGGIYFKTEEKDCFLVFDITKINVTFE